MFISVGYVHSSGDYPSRKTQSYNYKNIKEFIDTPILINSVKNINKEFTKEEQFYRFL